MKRPLPLTEAVTRDGRRFVIREGRLADAAALIAHARAVLAEPKWTVTELDEFQVDVSQEENWIFGFHERPRNLLLVADLGDQDVPLVVGVLDFTSPAARRMRHRGRLGISVQAPYRRLGVGEALLRALLGWAAAEPDLERVELSVFAHNSRAISLYLKTGFVEEGRRLRAYKLADGSYYDEVMMINWVKDRPA